MLCRERGDWMKTHDTGIRKRKVEEASQWVLWAMRGKRTAAGLVGRVGGGGGGGGRVGSLYGEMVGGRGRGAFWYGTGD